MISPTDATTTWVEAIYVRLLIKASTVDSDLLLRGTGLNLETLINSHQITLDQQFKVFSNYANTCEDPTWALKFGSRLSLNTFGPLGIAATSVPTLADGIDVWNNYFCLRIPYIKLIFIHTSQHIYARFVPKIPLLTLEPILMEMLCQIAQTYLEVFTEEPIHQATLHLNYPPPAHCKQYEQWFHCSVMFNQQYNEIIVPLSWQQLKCPLYNAPLWKTSLAECEALLSSQGNGDTTLHKVRLLLSESLDSHDRDNPVAHIPSASEIAETLHITSRTLIRRLKRTQTSYQALRDEVIKDRVLYLLAETSLSIANIGERVGYRDPANFGRVCQRWFGDSPGTVRKRRKKIV